MPLVPSHDPLSLSVRFQPTIVVWALEENKRPVGFAPWPEAKKSYSPDPKPIKVKKGKKK